jgi:hypothetical protein
MPELPSRPPAGFRSEFDWRACELLARQYERDDKDADAGCIRLGMPVDHASHIALTVLSQAFTKADSKEQP